MGSVKPLYSDLAFVSAAAASASSSDAISHRRRVTVPTANQRAATRIREGIPE